MGPHRLKRINNDPISLTQPALVHLTDPKKLSSWLWLPTLDHDENKVFTAHADAFIGRTNCLDEEYFPRIALIPCLKLLLEYIMFI